MSSTASQNHLGLNRRLFKVMSACAILGVLVIVGCPAPPNGDGTDGGSGDGDAEATVIRVYDTSTDIGIVAQDDDGDELAVFGEKDGSGKLLQVTGMSYVGDDGRSLTVWLGDDGLPERAVTGSDWIIEFVNYTPDTVDIFVTDPVGSTTIYQGVELDDAAVDALEQYAQSGKTGGAPKWTRRVQQSEITLSDGLRIGSLGVSWFGCGSNVGQILAAGSGIPSAITSCVGALLSTAAHFTGNEVLATASTTLSVTSCGLGGVGSCIGVGLTTTAEILEAADEWEDYYAGDMDGDGLPDDQEDCADGWQEYDGHCYKLTSVRTWDDAEAEALAAGGHLVAINDADENQWLLDTFGGENCWIGFHQLSGSSEPDGGWVWSSGAPVGYVNWCGGEPNDDAGEQWAEMKGTASYCAGGWNDQGRSTRTLRGIIELEP